MKIIAMALAMGLSLFAVPFAAADEAERIKTSYSVDDARVQSLRDQKLGYGEISKVLALAEMRDGGINDANVNAILAERNGPPKMGWGQIAKKQGTTIGALMGRVKSAEKTARDLEKREARAAVKQERREQRAERQNKPERPERPAKAERGKP